MKITFTTRIGGVLADVTAVTLSDPTGVYGVRRVDTGAVAVAAGTAMTRVSAGTYEHSFGADAGAAYQYYIAWTYAGETHHIERSAVAASAAASVCDAILASDLAILMAEYGRAVTVYTSAADLSGRAVTGIVTYGGDQGFRNLRGQGSAVSVKLYNSATLGISASEWTNRFEVGVPVRPGGVVVRKRTIRMLAGDAAAITWELG